MRDVASRACANGKGHSDCFTGMDDTSGTGSCTNRRGVVAIQRTGWTADDVKTDQHCKFRRLELLLRISFTGARPPARLQVKSDVVPVYYPLPISGFLGLAEQLTGAKLVCRYVGSRLDAFEWQGNASLRSLFGLW